MDAENTLTYALDGTSFSYVGCTEYPVLPKVQQARVNQD